MERSPYEAAFRTVLLRLEPYLDAVVIVGGWVPYLYRHYGGLASWRSSTSLTAEVDVLIERSLAAKGRPSISEILAEGGFHPVGRGSSFAVWVGNAEAGEKIEFLVPHRGTARTTGEIVRIDDQDGIGAISLADVDLLRRFRRPLRYPVDVGRMVEIWIPLLGAYVVNKAGTFVARQAPPGTPNPKRAKDLLYLCDVMAAGNEVVRQVEDDLAAMARDRKAGRTVRARIRGAVNNVRLVLSGGLAGEVELVAAMLREREPTWTIPGAAASIRGHLTDLAEILGKHAR